MRSRSGGMRIACEPRRAARSERSSLFVPALFVAGTDDPVGGFMRRDRTGEVVTGPYREVMIDGAGHWLQQERPDQVNEAVLDFLSGVKLS